MTPHQKSDRWALAVSAGLLLIRQASTGIDLISAAMLIPLLLCLIPMLDSLQSSECIRVWNRWRMCFELLERRSHPLKWWVNLIVCWPGAVFFAYALVMIPKR